MSDFMNAARKEAERRWPNPGSPGEFDFMADPETVAEYQRDAAMDIIKWAQEYYRDTPPSDAAVEATARESFIRTHRSPNAAEVWDKAPHDSPFKKHQRATAKIVMITVRKKMFPS